jgi:hypothetical protein
VVSAAERPSPFADVAVVGGQGRVCFLHYLTATEQHAC